MRQRGGVCFPAVALCLLMLAAGGVFAQSNVNTAELTGRVVDAQGAVLPGVSVEVRNPATGFTRRVVTDRLGLYRFDFLPVGSYELRAELAGFRPELRSGVSAGIGASLKIDFTLQPGTMAEEVVVVAAAPLVETTQASVGAVVGQEQIANLPLNGRDFLDFIALTPMSTTDDYGTAHIAGQRGVQNSFNIDGANDQSTFFGEERGTTRAPFTFSQGAIREFQVVASSYNVQFGNASGGIINAITKSGTNTFKGEAWYYFRNESMVDKDALGHEPTDFKQKQYGAAFGGPIVRDKLHFFVSYDGQRKDYPVFRQWKTFPAGREADFTAKTGLSVAEEAGGNQITTDDNDVYLGKVDWQASLSHLATVRYNNSNYDGANGTDTRYPEVGRSNNGYENGDFYSLVGNLNSVFSENVFNELILQHSNEKRPRLPNNDTLPEVFIRGYQADFGQRNYLPSDLKEKHNQIKDDFTYFLGAHTLKAGFNFDRVNYDNYFPRYASGQYQYTNWDNFFNDVAYSYQQSFYTNGGYTKFDVDYWALYLQDEWRPIPNLTVTYGLRYDMQDNPQPKVVNPDEPLTGQIPNDRDNWAPRAGFAWDPAGDGRTVVRGGYGYFYDDSSTILMGNVLNYNGITGLNYYLNCSRVTCPVFPNILASPQGLTADKPTIYLMDPNFQDSLTKRASLGVEHEIASNLVVGGDLVYSESDHLERIYDANLIPVGTTPWGGNLYDSRQVKNSNFSSIREFTSDGWGKYWAIVLKARKRWANNWMFDASYTYSVSKDTNSNDNSTSIGSYGSGEDPLDPASNYGYSDYDVRHRFVLSAVVLLPLDFQVSTIVKVRSGYPINPSSDQCWNMVGTRCYDPSSVFYRPYINGVHYGRNSFRQPWYRNVDLRVSKIFRFAGRYELEVLAEAFNLLGSDNLRSSNDRLVLSDGSLDPTFGELDLAGSPRQYQVGLKFRF